MSGFQYRLRSSLLVPIWVALPDLPTWGLIGKRRGKPRYVILLDKFGTPHLKNSDLASFLPRPYPGCCTSGTLSLRRKATSWYSQTLNTVYWRVGEGYYYVAPIPWFYAQQLRFSGDILPHINLYVVHRFGPPLWTGDLWTFHYLPCRRRTWTRGWM